MSAVPALPSRGQQNLALWGSTFAFTVCFAVWTIFSIIGIQIKKDLGLNDTQFGLLVATPILTGSLIRLFLGVWAEQYGGRIVFSLVMSNKLKNLPVHRSMLEISELIYATCSTTRSSCWRRWRWASPEVRSRSASPTCPSGSRRRSRAPRWASSVPATSARR